MNIESENTLKHYLKEIAKTDLLTREQETELAERVLQGDESARTHMIKANLRLVVKIAKDYANYGLPLSDLISEGNIGLMKAVERFDPSMGAKLSTYASWWIKQSIKRALSNQSKTIRLPVHLLDKLAKVRRISAVMSEELGREASDEELSEETGIPIRKLSLLRQASQKPASLDAPMNDDASSEFGDMISDDRALDPSDAMESKNLHGEIGDMMDSLDERESRIINARFGLDGVTPMTLEEVGREFGVSRERIRQLQTIALRKMRSVLRRKDKPLPALATIPVRR